MHQSKTVLWILRIAVAGEFFGHGMLALQGNPQWVSWIQQLGVTNLGAATQLLFLVGVIDTLVALFVLIRPMPAILLWATFWGFWTTIILPFVGQSLPEFLAEFANWGTPFVLLLLYGFPKTIREWWH